jgi:hypothetical protein
MTLKEIREYRVLNSLPQHTREQASRLQSLTEALEEFGSELLDWAMANITDDECRKLTVIQKRKRLIEDLLFNNLV